MNIEDAKRQRLSLQLETVQLEPSPSTNPEPQPGEKNSVRIISVTTSHNNGFHPLVSSKNQKF